MYKITVQNFQNRDYECASEQDILTPALRASVPILAACRSGGCGVCKIKVVEGKFERGICSKRKLTDEERMDNYSLACKTYPRSNMTITTSNS